MRRRETEWWTASLGEACRRIWASSLAAGGHNFPSCFPQILDSSTTARRGAVRGAETPVVLALDFQTSQGGGAGKRGGGGELFDKQQHHYRGVTLSSWPNMVAASGAQLLTLVLLLSVGKCEIRVFLCVVASVSRPGLYLSFNSNKYTRLSSLNPNKSICIRINMPKRVHTLEHISLFCPVCIAISLTPFITCEMESMLPLSASGVALVI